MLSHTSSSVTAPSGVKNSGSILLEAAPCISKARAACTGLSYLCWKVVLTVPRCTQFCCMIARDGVCFQITVAWKFPLIDVYVLSLILDKVSEWAVCRLDIEYWVLVYKKLYHSVSSLVDFVGRVMHCARPTHVCHIKWYFSFIPRNGRIHGEVNKWCGSVEWENVRRA